ncbi:MAG TPA: hypothetical protein VMD25_03065 [Acidobacteriaceae bacterium]|nr:hypothetical protein [Acidobacteriaceae bacterium]
MRRFLAFAVLLAFSLPVGLSIAGCGHNPNNYCIKNGHAYGIPTSQVVEVILQPETTGISLSWGQTFQAGPAQAYNCQGGTESVGSYVYTSKNLQLADISPTGMVCAGTWNRNSGGGTPDFSICTPPAGSSLSSFTGCTSTTCGIVQVTAQGAAVTSNPIDVYVHPPITSVTIPTQTACVSQGQTLSTSLLAETAARGPGGVLVCCPPNSILADGTTCPATQTSCAQPAANVGTITFAPVTSSIVTINNTSNPTNCNPITGTGCSTASNPNGIATANLPGSTVIDASIPDSDVTSAAGYFSTCPPTQINLSVNGGTSATVTPNSPQTIVASAVDHNGVGINGLTLNFASTQPQNVNASSTGLVTSTFPSQATITAVCSPPNCNPSPVNLVGANGNGMPVAANRVSINSPGRVTNEIWMGSSQSQYFSEVDLQTGQVAAPVRLPYLPNSMVMDQGGDTLYFGSYIELMEVSASSNSVSKEIPSVPGVVLAVSPTNNSVVVNDQLRQVIYLYFPSTGTATSIAGLASRAQFSPDGTTVYIAGVNPTNGQNTMFVYNNATGWSSYALSNQPTYSCPLDASPTNGNPDVPAYNPSWDPYCGPSLTLTVPSVAAFLSGTSTAARSFCANASSSPPYYPPAGNVPAPTTQLTATADGNHILGADDSTFTDILLSQTAGGQPGVPVGACPDYSTSPPLTLPTTFASQGLPLAASTGVTEIDEVVSSPYSNLAFVAYQGSGATGEVPYYVPTPVTSSTTSLTPGTLSAFQLSTISGASAPQSPVAGIFAPDGSLFFVSTSGDDLIHVLDTSTGTPIIYSQLPSIDPKLVNPSGTPVPAQFLAVKSVPTT